MTDIVSPRIRSRIMSNIRSKDTIPEKIVRSHLHRSGLRFKLHDKALPGKPDIVLPKYRTIVEVRGCFWHQHAGCKYAYKPKTRTDFWLPKLRATVLRDRKQKRELIKLGWTLYEVWECSTSPIVLDALVQSILKRIP